MFAFTKDTCWFCVGRFHGKGNHTDGSVAVAYESGTAQLQLGLDVNGRSTAQRGTAGTRSGYTHEDAPGPYFSATYPCRTYRPDSLRRDIYIFFLFTPVTPNRSVRDSTFRSAVQFNNNAASGLGGGIAVDGGDVT